MLEKEKKYYIRLIPALAGFVILAYYNVWLFWAILLITVSILMWIEVKWERLKNRIWHSEKRTEDKFRDKGRKHNE